MIFSNKLLTLGFLSAALTISSISVQAMDNFDLQETENIKLDISFPYRRNEDEKASRLSVAQFNALSFEDMKRRIEERLSDIILYKPYWQDYANVIRALLDGVSNGATSEEQLAIIMNSAQIHGNIGTGLFLAFYWREYLIAQFLLYRAGISSDDLETLLWLTTTAPGSTVSGSTVLCYASCAGPEYLDLILNHPMFKGSAENEAKLVRYILTPNQENGMTILHYAAIPPCDLIVVKKLIGKLLERVDNDTLLTLINTPVEAKQWYNSENGKTAAQIAEDGDDQQEELAKFLDSFTQEKIDCTVKARRGIKRCAELRKKLEAEKLKLRYTKEGISHCLEKLGDDCGFE